jgi:hypothetical protein
MPLGPKRAPGRYDVPVSNGAPEATSVGAIYFAALIRTNEGDIVVCMCRQTRAVWKATERGDAREDRVRLIEGQLLPACYASKFGLIPEYRRHQEECCTKVPREDQPMAPGQHRGHREQQLLLRS